MAATLIGRTGAVAGKNYAVADVVHIGAAREAHVRIRAEGVSRIHARLWREGDDYYLEDAGSANGTFLSGIRIRKDRLRHLDVVTLGRSVDLIFVIRDDEPEAAAPVRPRGIISATLEPLDGPDAGTSIEVPKGEITFGRADSNNVVVDSRAVSKVHARLERTPDLVRLQDLGSVNGTFVNDIRIDLPVVLSLGDRISLAGVREFQVAIEPSGEPGDSSASTPLAENGPVFSQEWKTRLVWSAEELAELAAPTPVPAASPPKVAAPPPPPQEKAEPGPQSVSKAGLPTVFAGAPLVPLPPRVRLVGATTHTLAPGATTVGRDVSATLRIDDRRASRAHAEIIVTTDEVTLEDKGSVNGTVVNGREIRTRQRLANGDRIKIGETEWTVEIG
jgi:pSer/pThr/pTyr-binding forkhead associated (FHA) protein